MSRIYDIPNSYEQALDALKNVHNGQRRVGKTGYLLLSPAIMEPCIMLKLHNSVIVHYYEDGRLYFNHHGWSTVTTQHWMNRVLIGKHAHVSRVGGTMTMWCNEEHTELPCTYIPNPLDSNDAQIVPGYVGSFQQRLPEASKEAKQ